MNPRLARILSEKRNEVDKLKKRGLLVSKGKNIPPIRDFKGAISVPGRMGLIAEIKFASPSAGIICEKTDPLSIGQKYEDAGAAAISLLTDRRFFKGELEQLPRLKKAVSLPILRKDFIIDEIQVIESFLYGADAILLIVRLLPQQLLEDLLEACKALGMVAVVEVHDRRDIKKAMGCRTEIIGINNRNLDTFEVDLRTTLELAPLVADKYIVVSESGIRDDRDIRLLKRTRTQAVLVGSSIMKSDNVLMKARELVNAGNLIRQD